MTVKTSFYKARDEVKKVFKEKKLSPSFANAFITLGLAIFHWIKITFIKTYIFIFKILNKLLPLPFVSTDSSGKPYFNEKIKTTIKKTINPSKKAKK